MNAASIPMTQRRTSIPQSLDVSMPFCSLKAYVMYPVLLLSLPLSPSIRTPTPKLSIFSCTEFWCCGEIYESLLYWTFFHCICRHYLPTCMLNFLLQLHC